MFTRNRKWILRSLQVLIALVLMLSVAPAGAHNSGGYYHGSDSDWKIENPEGNPDWMAGIPGYRRLSELSIPGTHDTGAHVYTFPIYDDYCQCQTLRLSTQLEAGIRYIDIRLARFHGWLEVFHGDCDQGHTFEDVLDDVVDFLETHREETIIMNVQENSEGPFGDNNQDFIVMVENYLKRTYHDPNGNPIGVYWDWVWTPTSGNPTLDEVRGKIVIEDKFSQVGETVDHGFTADVGQYSSLVLDGNGEPHFSYYDATSGDLMYARPNPIFEGQWTKYTVDIGDTFLDSDVGRYNSLAMDSDGNPHISYYDADNDALKYAYLTDSGWVTSRIDGYNDMGQYSSLALYKDVPYISYYDATMDELRLAIYVGSSSGNCVNPNWSCTVIDGGPGIDVGLYTSLALDAAGNYHISYYDATYGDLRYVHSNGSNPIYETVDNNGNVGLYSSLALAVDAEGHPQPHISYYDATNGDLKYAFRDSGGAWNIQKVDYGSANDVGQYSSLALDTHGNPHISYYDNTTDKNDLKYIFWEYDFGWTLKIGETQGDVGKYTSIALDDNDHPHISYYDSKNGDLMYDSNFCGNDGGSEITQYGLRICAKGHGMWHLSHDWELYTKKWPSLKAALDEADKAPRDMFYINGLNASGAVYPWFAASGHSSPGTGAPRLWTGLLWDDYTGSSCLSVDCYPDFPRLNCAYAAGITTCSVYYEGMNELTLTYLNAHKPELRPKRWGIIPMDFPGEDLIDAIISSNFPTMKGIYIPIILK